MIRPRLADIDTIRIAAAQVDNRWRHQTVVQHHVSLLHQAQGTKGQQVWITRACANQVNLTLITLAALVSQALLQ